MPRKIEVKHYISASEYNSLSDSVLACKEKNKSKIDKLGQINGRFVLSYQYNYDSVYLHLDNSIIVKIWVSDGRIEWDISNDTLSPSEPLLDIVDFQFCFSDGRILEWTLGKNLAKFVNKQIVLAPSEQYLFMYTKDRIEYIFDSLVDLKLKNKYLTLSKA